MIAAVACGLAVLLVWRPGLAATPAPDRPAGPAGSADGPDWMVRHRMLLCVASGLGAWTLIGGPVGPVAAVVVAAVTWRMISTAEPAVVRRTREQVRADLPQAIRLLGGALAAGTPTDRALLVVGEAVGGPVGAMFSEKAAALALGADPEVLWSQWSATDEVASLGRALARAHASGMPVAAVISRLADDAARDRLTEVEQRARAVGVRAAIPLGVCFLPAFVLVGVVPQVGSLIGEFTHP